MKSTPSKRRKLSPATSAPIDASLSSTAPARASYLSPTKTSLARFHPNILSKATKETSSRRSEGRRSSAARSLNPTPLRTAPRRSTRISASPTREPSLSPSGQLRNEAGFNAPPRRRSRTPGSSVRPQLLEIEGQNPTSANVGSTGDEPSRSLMDEEQLSQLVRRSARSTRGNRLARVRAEEELEKEQEEPELPPTPEQLGLEKRPEEPKGLLSSSPSGRAEKRRQAGTVGSSPSKLYKVQQPIEQETQDLINIQESAQTKKQVASKAHTQDDPEIVRRQELLNKLSTQLESLRKDVSFLEVQVWRTQELTQSEQDDEGHREKLIAILTSDNPSNAIQPTPRRPKSLSMRLAVFLPFSKHRTSEKVPDEASNSDLILSHRPLDLPDPLPHLKIFSSFNITSTDTLMLPPPDEADLENGPIFQQRDVELKTSKPPFSMNLQLVINTQTQTMTGAELLDISPWANFELGNWIRSQAPLGDTAAIGWAAQNYLKESEERSTCWAKCYAKWPNLLSRKLTEDVNPPELKHSHQAQDQPGDAGDPIAINIENVDNLPSHSITMHNGRQNIVFSDGKVRLLVSWWIGFNWIGKASKHISLRARFPTAWVKADERASLTRAKEAFHLLLLRVGEFGAIEQVVGVIFGKDRGC